MTRRTDKPTIMLTVTNGRYTIGFVARGRDGFEAFDVAERSLGIFTNIREAANAVSDDGEKTCS